MSNELDSKLEHLPPKAIKLILNFAQQVSEAFGDNLYSLLIYGSAAGKNYLEDKSDINTVVVLNNIRTPDLNIMTDILNNFAKKGLALPLMFEKDHISTSLDTFPIEFSDMRDRHILIFGIEPFEGVKIETKNLRYQCERELKSILVNLRRGFLTTGSKRENIEQLMEGSLSSVVAAARGLIWMAGQIPPESISDLLALLQEIYKSDISAIDRVWRLKKGQSGATAMLEALFEDYIHNIEYLAAITDRH